MKKFTKFAALFLTLALVFSFAACSNQGKTAKAPEAKVENEPTTERYNALTTENAPLI